MQLRCWLPALLLSLTVKVHAETPVSYRKQIAPIFASACNACHGGATPQSGLTLTTYAALSRGGRRGKAVVAGNPAGSLLVQYIDGTKQPRMPIGGELKPAEIALIKLWIKEGAKSDGDAPATAPPPPHIPLLVKVLPQAATLAWSRDSRWLAVGTYREVKLIDTTTGKVAQTLGGHADVVRGLAFSPDGGTLAAAGGVPGQGGEVKLWTIPGGSPGKTFIGHTDCIYSLAWQPDGKRFVTCSYDKTVKVWDVSKSDPVADLKEHAEAVFAVAWSGSGKLFASGGADKSIRIWDAPNTKRLFTLAGHTDAVTCLAFHPTAADQLASGSADKTIRVWTLKSDSGEAAKTLNNPDIVTDLRYSPDGKYIAAACSNGAVVIWNLEKSSIQQKIDACPDTVLSVAYRPDGQAVAAGGYDGSVKLFNVADGKVAAAYITAPPRAAVKTP